MISLIPNYFSKKYNIFVYKKKKQKTNYFMSSVYHSFDKNWENWLEVKSKVFGGKGFSKINEYFASELKK